METLQGLEGVEVFMDNILIYGATEEEHDSRQGKVMQRIETAGLKLNREKCSIRQSGLRFLRHLIDRSGAGPRQSGGYSAAVTTNRCAGVEKDTGNGELSWKIHPQPFNSGTAAV